MVLKHSYSYTFHLHKNIRSKQLNHARKQHQLPHGDVHFIPHFRAGVYSVLCAWFRAKGRRKNDDVRRQSERERGGGVGIFLTYPTKNMNESMLTFSRVHTLTCWGIKKAKTHTHTSLAVASSRSLISCMRVCCCCLRLFTPRTKGTHVAGLL